MKLLTDSLKEHDSEIRRRLYLGYVHWEDLIARLETQERSTSGVLGDEQVWTFLVGCGYAISGTEGLARVTNILTGTDLRQPDDAKIWLEVLPQPPRDHEGATHVDLAVGSIPACAGLFQARISTFLGRLPLLTPLKCSPVSVPDTPSWPADGPAESSISLV